MQDITKLRKLYELKRVYRENSVGGRKESSAEHSWSTMMLADYFFEAIKPDIDRQRVFELLLYHDLVEIESGDVPIHQEEKRKNKKETELKAMKKLKEEIPKEIRQRFEEMFIEFEELKTPEARFAKAVDRMDALIHELDNKEDWKGWDEAMVRKYFEKHISDYPKIRKMFEELVSFIREEGYFEQ